MSPAIWCVQFNPFFNWLVEKAKKSGKSNQFLLLVISLFLIEFFTFSCCFSHHVYNLFDLDSFDLILFGGGFFGVSFSSLGWRSPSSVWSVSNNTRWPGPYKLLKNSYNLHVCLSLPDLLLLSSLSLYFFLRFSTYIVPAALIWLKYCWCDVKHFLCLLTGNNDIVVQLNFC